MKQKIFCRAALGAPLGLAISWCIALIVSAVVGDGQFYAVVPSMAADCGSEFRAVLLQTMASAFYGAVWGGASVIWEIERWSLTRMTFSHLALCSLATLPVAWLSRWMPHSFWGAVGYFGLFFVIYAAVWLGQYLQMRRRLDQINPKIQQDGLSD